MIRNAQDAIDYLWSTVIRPATAINEDETPKGAFKYEPPAGTGSVLSDEEVISKASHRSATFVKLYRNGDTSGYDSTSSADLALMNILAFWCGGDRAQMERLFSQSALGQRQKWRERADYRELTIDKALAGRTDFYSRTKSSNTQDQHNHADADEGEAGHEGFQSERQEATIEISDRYRVEGNRFQLKRDGKDGDTYYVTLSDCMFWITEDLVRDDGATEESLFTVEGMNASGKRLQPGTVRRSEFAAMNWPLTLWGLDATIYAGQGTKDHVRVAVQLLSAQRGYVVRREYQQTGWRNLGGRWAFLHAAGALGADGNDPSVVVTLPGPLGRVLLPDQPAAADMRSKVLETLHLLDLAPLRITAPLFATVIRAFFAEIHVVDMALSLVGPSGAGKTETAALVQAFVGADFSSRQLMISWSSTANAIERLTFQASCIPTVVDDLALYGPANEVARRYATFERVVRSAGNADGRGRMNADGTLRPTYFPRGAVFSTAEGIPPGHSVIARAPVVEIGPKDIDFDRLTTLQRSARSGVFASVSSAFLQWMAGQYEDLRTTYPTLIEDTRAELMTRPSAHRRTPDMSAGLLSAAAEFLRFCRESGALTEDESAQTYDRVESGVLDFTKAQADHLKAEDPVDGFIGLIQSALNSGMAHLADVATGSEPIGATAAGWRIRMIRTRDGLEPEAQPQGLCIGWTDESNCYLDLKSTINVCQGISTKNGSSIGLGATTLAKRIDERGLVVSREPSHLQIKRTIAGTRRRVLHLARETVLPRGDEAERSNMADFFQKEVA